jgi:hypothetical protein
VKPFLDALIDEIKAKDRVPVARVHLFDVVRRLLVAVDAGEVQCDVVNGRFWSAVADLRAAVEAEEGRATSE